MANRKKAVTPKAATPKINQRALIVAIDDYPGAANDLPSCVEDSKAITALLKTAPYGFEEIVTYTDEQATLANVTAGLKWLFGNQTSLTANDRLVFYFSGHGYRTEKDGLLRECLCLHDGFLFDRELSQTTQSLPVGILTVILDCCHAGGMEKNFREVLTTGEKSGKPAEATRIKNWFPEGEEFAKTFAAEQSILPVKAFGCVPSEVPEFLTSKPKSGSPEVNGLLITACRAEQTASASSSQTQGKSAFTYSVLEAISQNVANAVVSNSQLFDRVSAVLSSLKFKQIPVLHEPANAPGLKNKSFISLQPTLEAMTPAKSFDPSISVNSTITQQKGEQPMSTVQTSALKLDRPLTQADAKFCSAVMQSCLQVVPTMYETMNGKDFQSDGQEPMADGKFWGALIGPAITAIPGIINAVSGKDFQTASAEPISEDKFWTEVVQQTIEIVPDLIGAFRRKDFQAEAEVPMTSAVETPTPATVPAPTPIVSTPVSPAPNGATSDGVETPTPPPVTSTPVSPVPNGVVPTAVDEKFWGALLAGMLPAVAGAIAP